MKYILDGTRMTDRSAAHAVLAETLGFPAYYGANLDALYDCLTDLRGADITLTATAAVINTLGGYGCDLIRVFLDAKDEEIITFTAE